jgi:hypothetical protein
VRIAHSIVKSGVLPARFKKVMFFSRKPRRHEIKTV